MRSAPTAVSCGENPGQVAISGASSPCTEKGHRGRAAGGVADEPMPAPGQQLIPVRTPTV
jgi:hypothetical protein